MIKKITFVFVLAAIVCLSIVPVAAADDITETNGYYTFNLKRLLFPSVIYHRSHGFSDIGEKSLNVSSIGWIIADTDRSEVISLYSYYYSSGTIGDNLHVETADPYRQDFSYTVDRVFFSELVLPSVVVGTNTIERSMPFAVYVDPGFTANVSYIEMGNIYDGNDQDIVPTEVHSVLDTDYIYWGYVKLTSVNGHFMIIAFKTGDPHLSTISGTTAQVQSETNTKAFPAYRKYWLNQNVDQNSYDEGYAEGFNQGVLSGDEYQYSQGYDTGYQLGYSDAVNAGIADYSTFAGWAKAVLSFLDIKLFGTFGLAEILAVGIGVAVLSFVIKLLRS